MKSAANLIVVSPHLDDGVFSCGEALALAGHATVITVFAGAAELPRALSSWDEVCGFRDGDDVMAARRDEDARALKILGARPVWLDFVDAQYAASPAVEAVAAALRDALEQALQVGALNRICFPLGLFHSDHKLVRAAMLQIMADFPEADWLLYEDVLYRGVPELRDEAMTTIEAAGRYMTPYHFPSNAALRKLKKEAVLCYQSQLNGLLARNRAGYLSLFAEERYLLLSLPLGSVLPAASMSTDEPDLRR